MLRNRLSKSECMALRREHRLMQSSVRPSPKVLTTWFHSMSGAAFERDQLERDAREELEQEHRRPGASRGQREHRAVGASRTPGEHR